MSSALVGPNISSHYISITFSHYISNVITFATFLVGSPPVVQNYHGKFESSMERAEIDRACLSMAILNSKLLHVTLHHPTKFEADSSNPLRVEW